LKTAYLREIGLNKNRAVAEQRKRIAKRIKALQPAVSNRQIGRTLGVGARSIDRDVASNDAVHSEIINETNGAENVSAPNGARGYSGAQAAELVERGANSRASRSPRRLRA
jgi:hypothetical protein